MVCEQLDRVVSTAVWFNLFPTTKVKTLTCSISDHSPILILPMVLGGSCRDHGTLNRSSLKTMVAMKL